jgi:2-dehydro-3-deoxyphosphooctonate aldolase (KDO 8-P synthase)
MEVHDNPSKALSDPNTVLDIKYLKNILIQAKMTHEFRSKLIESLGEDRVHIDE